MDPISMISGASSLVGLGMSLFGSSKSTAAAQAVSQESQAIAGLDMKVNDQRQQQMTLTAQRQQLQNIRNGQLARSMALTSATGQGAQFGTGLQGGYGQISGDENTNNLNTNQNLMIGNNIFALDNQIDQHKMNMAQYQGDMATGQGLSSLGSSIGRSAGTLGNLFGNMFGSTSNNNSGSSKPSPSYQE